MKPAPVRSRSSLTGSAVISAMWCGAPVRGRGGPAPAVVRVVDLARRRIGRRRGRASRPALPARRCRFGLLGGLAGQLGGDLLGSRLGGVGAAASATGRPAGAGQQLVLVGVGLEGQRRAAGEGRDELVGRAGSRRLGLGRRLAISGSGSLARAARSLLRPRCAASATSVHSSRIARIASSLAGMM